jgi:thioredoxin 1
MITHVSDETFKEEVLNSDIPVLVDFWATWCGPCKMLAPVIEQISQNLDGKIKVVKLDVDKNPITSMSYDIASIPTVVLFDQGKSVNKLIGFRPLDQIESAVKGTLNL